MGSKAWKNRVPRPRRRRRPRPARCGCPRSAPCLSRPGLLRWSRSGPSGPSSGPTRSSRRTACRPGVAPAPARSAAAATATGSAATAHEPTAVRGWRRSDGHLRGLLDGHLRGLSHGQGQTVSFTSLARRNPAGSRRSSARHQPSPARWRRSVRAGSWPYVAPKRTAPAGARTSQPRANRENRATRGPHDLAGRGHQRLAEAAETVVGQEITVA
jgi:hypothetical protein